MPGVARGRERGLLLRLLHGIHLTGTFRKRAVSEHVRSVLLVRAMHRREWIVATLLTDSKTARPTPCREYTNRIINHHHQLCSGWGKRE